MSDWEIIDSYSRAQAIKDGVLIDVTEHANKVGIRYPLAITANLFHQYIEPTKELEAQGQSLLGRLADVFQQLITTIKQAGEHDVEIHFLVGFLMNSRRKENIGVWACVDGGDDGNPVITIMLEGED
jgi:hypothetical protein